MVLSVLCSQHYTANLMTKQCCEIKLKTCMIKINIYKHIIFQAKLAFLRMRKTKRPLSLFLQLSYHTHTHMHQVWKKSPKMNWGKGTRKCTREPHKKNLPIGLKDFFKESLIDAWEVLLKFLTLQLGCYGNVVTCCFKHFCLQKYQQEHY